MSANTRWLISLGWGIPVIVALAIGAQRQTIDEAGEQAGVIILLVTIVPAFLLALAFLTIGAFLGFRTWRATRPALGTGDLVLLAAGLLGALIGWSFVVGGLFVAAL
jgi:hypothetical protein